MSFFSCLVGFLLPLAVAISQCDGISQLQTHKMAHDKVLADPCLSDLNTGVCQSTSSSAECVGCEGGETIPSGGGGFPSGFLACSNEDSPPNADGVCKLSTGKDGVYTFGEPNDYLTCSGQNACTDFNVQNAGAICCSGENSCVSSLFELATLGTCTHDVCCTGKNTCGQASFLSVNTLWCTGAAVCTAVQATLSRDLLCSGNAACSEGTFNFQNQGGDTCIACTSGACRATLFNLAAGLPESPGVTSALCTGIHTCQDSVWEVANFRTVRLYCRGLESCQLILVSLGTDSALRLFCDGLDSCLYFSVNKNGLNAKCECTAVNGGLCPEFCKDTVNVDPPARCVTEVPCCSVNCGYCGCQTTMTTSGGAHGDPHMDTLDGQHYMLLRQGTFSLWHFTGRDAEISAGELSKKMPADFNIYAHYSGHTSYTKGLLLLDQSGGVGFRRALEMTSNDCRWRSKTTQGAWKDVRGPQLLSLPDADGDNMTAFRVVQSSAETHIELLMTEGTRLLTTVGKLIVRCRAGHFMNVKMSMPKQDVHFVEGQLGPRKEGDTETPSTNSFIQGTQEVGRGDQEFQTSKEWEELGGSSIAASYLKLVDSQGAALLQGCEAGKQSAHEVCAKYLGEPSTSGSSQFTAAFDSCVFDVCHGGGEVAAQLAAEIWNAK